MGLLDAIEKEVRANRKISPYDVYLQVYNDKFPTPMPENERAILIFQKFLRDTGVLDAIAKNSEVARATGTVFRILEKEMREL